MNVAEVKKGLKGLGGEPLEKLSAAQLKKVGKFVSDTRGALEKVRAMDELGRYLASLSTGLQKALKKSMSEKGLKKPKNSADPTEFRKHLRDVQSLARKLEEGVAQKKAYLEKLRKMKFELALQEVESLSDAERKEYSELAALATLSGGRTKKLKLSTSEKNNRQWLSVLQRELAGDNLATRR